MAPLAERVPNFQTVIEPIQQAKELLEDIGKVGTEPLRTQPVQTQILPIKD